MNLGINAGMSVQLSCRWSSASLTHGQVYHKTSSTKLFINGENGYVHARKPKDITFNIC